MKYILAITLLCFAVPALADYGWIPEYQRLNMRAGMEFYSTDQNYNPTGALANLTANGAKLNEFRMWLGGEYGIAQDWSMLGRIGFENASETDLVTAQTLATGSGLSDILLGVKWTFKTDYPILTAEVYTVIPASSNTVLAPTQLVTSDGIFNIGMILHAGTQAGPFVFDLSPGILGRFGGFSSLATLELAVQLNFPRGYARAYGRGVYPFQNIQPYDTNEAVHSAPGAGGSYAKLNGRPQGASAGALIGVAPIRNVRVEAYIEHAVWGQEYPYFLSFGFNLGYNFDFFQPRKKTRIREVPFEGEQPSGDPDN